MMFWVVIASVILSIPSGHCLFSPEIQEIFGPAVKNVAPNSEMYHDILEVTGRFGTDPDNWPTDAKDTIADIKSDLAETVPKRKSSTSRGHGTKQPGGSVKSPAPPPAVQKPKPPSKPTILDTVQTYFTRNQQQPTRPNKSLLDKLAYRFKTQRPAPKPPTSGTRNHFPLYPPTHHKPTYVHALRRVPAQPVRPRVQYHPYQTLPISFNSLPSPISLIPEARPSRYSNFNRSRQPTRAVSQTVYNTQKRIHNWGRPPPQLNQNPPRQYWSSRIQPRPVLQYRQGRSSRRRA